MLLDICLNIFKICAFRVVVAPDGSVVVSAPFRIDNQNTILAPDITVARAGGRVFSLAIAKGTSGQGATVFQDVVLSAGKILM